MAPRGVYKRKKRAKRLPPRKPPVSVTAEASDAEFAIRNLADHNFRMGYEAAKKDFAEQNNIALQNRMIAITKMMETVAQFGNAVAAIVSEQVAKLK